MKTFIGTDQQLANALDSMADSRPITQAEKAICAEAAIRLRVAVESGQNMNSDQETE